MSFGIVITHAGRVALVNAANTGTLPVQITQIGVSATAITPAESLVALPGELKRVAAIAGEVVADDVIHVTLKDESADAYSLRSVALYLADGTLFACAGQADPILIKSTSAVALIAFDIGFADVNAATIAFGETDFMLPSANADRQGVVELATLAEAQTGTDASRALTPQTARGALLPWLLGMDGAGSGIDADTVDGVHLSQILTMVNQAIALAIPRGIIAEWSGSIASIPAGWALCNGGNGTPDLRDRFVIGAGGGLVPGVTGGALQHGHAITVDGHALTLAQIPAHGHDVLDPGHAHQQRRDDNRGAQATSAGNPDGSHGTQEYGATSPATTGITVAPAGGGQAHAHGASASVASNLPPYFALAYIMKL